MPKNHGQPSLKFFHVCLYMFMAVMFFLNHFMHFLYLYWYQKHTEENGSSFRGPVLLCGSSRAQMGSYIFKETCMNSCGATEIPYMSSASV